MSAWNLDRVVNAFAEAAVNPELWVKALDIVTSEVQGFGAMLLPTAGGTLPSIPYTAAMAPSFEAYFRDGWYLRDDRFNGLPMLMKTGVVDDLDGISVEHMKRNPYYQEFLAPHGLRWYAGVRVSCGEDIWVLSIQRTIKQGPFSAEEKGRLATLVRSLPASVAVAQALGSTNGSNILETFEFSQTAAVLVNRMGKIIRPNKSAERLLQGDVRIFNRRIISNDACATATLDRSLHELLWRREGAALASAVPLPRAGRRPLIAYPARLSSLISNPISECQAIIILVDPEKRSYPPAVALRKVFHLTEAEARLAARLGSGDSLEETCDTLGIMKDTGRNHLKNVFAKTGTHRQAALVALLAGILDRSEQL